MTYPFSALTKRLSPKTLLSRHLLALGAAVGLAAAAQAQTSVTFSTTQTTTAQNTAFTEAFTNATASAAANINLGTYTTTGDPTNGNINWTTLGTNSFTTSNAQAASPLNSPTDKFLAVGSGPGQTQSVTLTFTGTNIHYFGLLWGSIDAANTVQLNLLNNGTASSVTYTPTTIGLGTGANDYVNFFTTSNAYRITSAVFTYNTAAFEIDNVSFGVVPEPKTWLCVALLVGGAIWLAHRQSGRSVRA